MTVKDIGTFALLFHDFSFPLSVYNIITDTIKRFFLNLKFFSKNFFDLCKRINCKNLFFVIFHDILKSSIFIERLGR